MDKKQLEELREGIKDILKDKVKQVVEDSTLEIKDSIISYASSAIDKELVNRTVIDLKKAEYEKTIDLWKTFMDIRRKDLVYITTIEVGIFVIIKTNFFDLNGIHLVFALFGLIYAIIGFNNERRLAVYNVETRERIKTIESNNDLSLYSNFRKKFGMREFGIHPRIRTTGDKYFDISFRDEVKGWLSISVNNQDYRPGWFILKNQTIFFFYYLSIIIIWAIILIKNLDKIPTVYNKIFL